MTPPFHSSLIDAFADALVLEIKAEMGRRDLSSRGLGRMIGWSSQYVSTRLDGGNPRTGIRVPLTVRDIAAIASALDMNADELMSRAQAALESDPKLSAQISSLAAKRAQRVAAEADDLPRVADPNSMDGAEREALEMEGQD